MSRIRGKNTGPEIRIRSMCHGLGLRFRCNKKDLPGKPDIVFRKHKTCVFVNGCYWHMHDCKKGRVVPKTNAEFWQQKRLATVERDKRKAAELERLGWRVLIYWECELDEPDALLNRIRSDFALQGH